MARQVRRDYQDLLARVACLYFIDGLTQEAVAREFLPARADVVLVGIGTDDDSTTVRSGCSTTEEMDHLRRKRAVGDVLIVDATDARAVPDAIALETPASSSRTRRSQTGGVQ